MNLLEVDLSLFQIQRKQNSRFKLNNTATHRILRIAWQYPVINKKEQNGKQFWSWVGWIRWQYRSGTAKRLGCLIN